jgi:hypothetical protein
MMLNERRLPSMASSLRKHGMSAMGGKRTFGWYQGAWPKRSCEPLIIRAA